MNLIGNAINTTTDPTGESRSPPRQTRWNSCVTDDGQASRRRSHEGRPRCLETQTKCDEVEGKRHDLPLHKKCGRGHKAAQSVSSPTLSTVARRGNGFTLAWRG